MDNRVSELQNHTNALEESKEPTKQALTPTDDAGEIDAVRKVEEATTPSMAAQQGVQSVEAVTLTWTKSSLILAFVW